MMVGVREAARFRESSKATTLMGRTFKRDRLSTTNSIEDFVRIALNTNGTRKPSFQDLLGDDW
jgi:hypothetical protein